MSSKAWNTCPISKVLQLCCGGVWGDPSDDNGVGVLRTNNITDDFKLDLSDVAVRNVPQRSQQKLGLIEGDVVMTKSNSIERIGACAYFRQPEDDARTYVPANFCQLLRFDRSVIDPEYGFFWVMGRESQSYLKSIATGTSSSLQNINAEKIGSLPIRYPVISEQRRIATRIREMIEKLDEIQSLSSDAPKEVTELKHSLVLGQTGQKRNLARLEELVEWVQESEPVMPHHDYMYAGIRSFGKGLFVRGSVNSDDFAYKSLRRLRTGDFIYPKLMAWEGAFAMVTDKFDGMVVSPEFVVFRPKSSRISSEVLDAYFRSPVCLEDVFKASTGSNRRRRRLNPKAFLTLSMPVPSDDEQKKLRAVYKLEAEAEEAWANRKDEIKAIRDSILRKAFAGEL